MDHLAEVPFGGYGVGEGQLGCGRGEKGDGGDDSDADAGAFLLFSPLPTPSAAKDEESEDDFDEIGVAVRDEFEKVVTSGKRSRDEVDSGWEEGVEEEEGGGKKARVEEIEREPEEEDEDDFDEFDEVGGEGDPNPLIAVGDKMVSFNEVGEELQAAMVRSFVS